MYNFTSIHHLVLIDPLNILGDQSSGISKNDSQKEIYTSIFSEMHNELLSFECMWFNIILPMIKWY